MPINNEASISVVISAYSDGEGLISTVESVFEQLKESENIDLLLEVIVVDDGADATVKQALASLEERFDQLIVIRQTNEGLTKALIKGCLIAKHNYIARIDVGDTMLPTRLRKQINYFEKNPSHSAVATWANLVTNEGYPIHTLSHSDARIKELFSPNRLKHLTDGDFMSPPHFTMMFRKSMYLAAGGYRSEFYFAQDVDLWLRLCEQGDIGVVEDELTQSVFATTSISGSNSESQGRLMDLALQSAELRRQQKSEVELLKKAEKIRPQATISTNSSARFKAVYFIAKCLLDNNHPGAREYFFRAIKLNSISIKAWLGLLKTFIK